MTNKVIKGWLFLVFSYMFMTLGRNHASRDLLIVASVFAGISGFYLISDFVETFLK